MRIVFIPVNKNASRTVLYKLSSVCVTKEVLNVKYRKNLMHCHCGTNNRAPLWTFTDPYKPEVRPGVREESASPAWLAATAMNACETKVYIWRLDTEGGPTLYRKCHSHNTPGKRHNST